MPLFYVTLLICRVNHFFVSGFLSLGSKQIMKETRSKAHQQVTQMEDDKSKVMTELDFNWHGFNLKNAHANNFEIAKNSHDPIFHQTIAIIIFILMMQIEGEIYAVTVPWFASMGAPSVDFIPKQLLSHPENS